MRFIPILFALFSFSAAKAQTWLPYGYGGLGFSAWQPLSIRPAGGDNPFASKWRLEPYVSAGIGYGFFNGQSITALYAPVGLRLDRRINNNLYAFGSASVAPTFFSATSNFYNASQNGFNRANLYGMGIVPRLELGLMYVNDAHTFSISGSIGVERSGYPMFLPQAADRRQK